MVHKAKLFGGHHNCEWAFPSGSGSKESACNAGDSDLIPGFDPCVQSPDWEDPLEKQMATLSSILAQEIPWIEEPGRLQSMGSQKNQTGLSN